MSDFRRFAHRYRKLMAGLEQAAEREYKQAADAEVRVRNTWYEIAETMEDVRRQQCASIFRSGDYREWELFDAHGQWLQMRLTAAEREWRQAVKDMEQQRQYLHDRYTATQTWVQLSDAADWEHRVDVEKREQVDMDELALQRYRKAADDTWR
ncbi:hypothetical protein C7445_10231 [Alicyclobacillus sacchari]|uniref:Flagellar FliJ protein n=1 Tax=Alicyclobacillus sacchari TaxID=392010 RepID=A0A4R8LS63_9BACL|nr:hypothetical protein [Alicyclobacillus sacchari]TDY50479.1 hypothetical protein C7445_10231 [Alicyclobacillus sacchari]GMA59006.1 hypothetical protein GCM10025858_35090 [Alicyclobacillus sacchari]